MEEWGERPIEIASLFNPAFCSVILRDAVKGFQNEQSIGMNYALIYLILPIVLHKTTRDKLPIAITVKMHSWLTQNREIKIQFPARVRGLLDITKEGMIYGLQAKMFVINENGNLKATSKKVKPEWESSSEPFICSKKAQFVGRWLANAGDIKTIYHMWGVRP
jgi:hypothetical protein